MTIILSALGGLVVGLFIGRIWGINSAFNDMMGRLLKK